MVAITTISDIILMSNRDGADLLKLHFLMLFPAVFLLDILYVAILTIIHNENCLKYL